MKASLSQCITDGTLTVVHASVAVCYCARFMRGKTGVVWTDDGFKYREKDAENGTVGKEETGKA